MEESEKQLRKNIADKLRIYRAKERISQEQLAEKSNLTQTYVYKLENEMANPSIFVILKLAKALNVTVNDLIY
jgi:transcriptional regulator with XRE-family HTH domain